MYFYNYFANRSIKLSQPIYNIRVRVVSDKQLLPSARLYMLMAAHVVSSTYFGIGIGIYRNKILNNY